MHIYNFTFDIMNVIAVDLRLVCGNSKFNNILNFHINSSDFLLTHQRGCHCDILLLQENSGLGYNKKNKTYHTQK